MYVCPSAERPPLPGLITYVVTQLVLQPSKLVGTGIKSLFVIHDALLLDVPPSNCSMIRDIANEGLMIEGVGNFPLGLKVISASGA